MFLIGFPRPIYSQQANDKINLNALNEKLLEHLIKVKIDEVRQQQKLAPLHNDSVLYVAAKFHANYLFNKGELSHTEPENKKMETPQKRADFFGAINYLVGENVAFTLVGLPVRDKKSKIHINTTYDETATDFVTLWVNSPGHYKNIITPNYNATGLAIYVDTKTKRIYAVQKFAQILFKYSFKSNTKFFSYSDFIPPKSINSFDSILRKPHKGKHVHRLKAITDSSKCKTCFIADSNFHFGQTRIEYKGKGIYLVSNDPQPILDLLLKRKDGFAAEIVNYNPFDCGNPEYYTQASRRNGQCIFNGKVLKPIYRKKALAGFKGGAKNRQRIQTKITDGKIKIYSLKLGKIPKNQTAYFEVNLAMIQKRRVCKVMHFSSVCGDTLEKFYELPFYSDTLNTVASVESDYRNFRFNVPFQKNKATFELKDIKPILDSVISEYFIADTIEINAFSSIEGSEKINQQLQKERAINLANTICKNQKRKVHQLITAEENWTLFKNQLASNKQLEPYKGKTQEEVKLLLKDSSLQKKWEPFLAPQRLAKVRIHAKEPISDKTIERYLLSKTKTLTTNIPHLQQQKKWDSLTVLLDSLTFFMEVAYTKIKAKVIAPTFFKYFEIGESKVFNAFHVKRLKYKLDLIGIQENNANWVRTVYTELVNLYNKDERSFFINYNMLNLIQKYEKLLDVSIDDKRKNSYIEELRRYALSEREKVLAEQLSLNFWFQMARLPLTSLPESEQADCLQALYGIHNYFAQRELSTVELNKLGAFYLYHSQANWVVEILAPEFTNKKNNPEGLKILAKTLYQNYEETGDTSYYTFLEQVYDIVGKTEWCPMFIGPCNISFQALDYERFRNYYCERCADYLNAAKRPMQATDSN